MNRSGFFDIVNRLSSHLARKGKGVKAMTIIIHDKTYRRYGCYAYRDHLPELDQTRFHIQCEAYICADRNYPPHYPMPATCEIHMSPYLIDHWQLFGLIDPED